MCLVRLCHCGGGSCTGDGPPASGAGAGAEAETGTGAGAAAGVGVGPSILLCGIDGTGIDGGGDRRRTQELSYEI